MKVESRDMTIKELFHEAYYRIPRFQRGYGWTRSNIEDLWNDAIVDATGDYFIGSMIVFPGAADTRDIVDGQQRLTTITLLLVAIRDALASNGFTDLARGLHQFIERADVDNNQRYVLRTETSAPYLQEYIQKFDDADTVETLGTDEEKQLADAFIYFQQQLSTAVSGIRQDSTLNDVDMTNAIRDKLLHIRDRALGLQVILVYVDEEDDAYVIFETLNSRGKDLTVSDLLKNWILRDLRQSNRDVDIPRDRWRSIQDRFAESGADISLNRFIHHAWLTRHSYVSEKKLFPAIKAETRATSAKKSLLEQLVEDSKLYRAMFEPAAYKWKDQDSQLVASVQALVDFRVRQAHPFVLAVLRARADGLLTLKHAKRALRAVECFHFLQTAVVGKSSSGGISQMYASHARALLSSNKDSDRINAVTELCAKLRDRVPTEDEFADRFQQLQFSSTKTTQKKLVQYILRSQYLVNASGAVPDFSKMTIEHLAPEKPRSGRPMQGFDSIGNLLLMDETLNGLLANRAYADKQPLLANAATKGQLWVDPFILDSRTWSRAKITRRAKRMAAEAYNTVWAF